MLRYTLWSKRRVGYEGLRSIAKINENMTIIVEENYCLITGLRDDLKSR